MRIKTHNTSGFYVWDSTEAPKLDLNIITALLWNGDRSSTVQCRRKNPLTTNTHSHFSLHFNTLHTWVISVVALPTVTRIYGCWYVCIEAHCLPPAGYQHLQEVYFTLMEICSQQLSDLQSTVKCQKPIKTTSLICIDSDVAPDISGKTVVWEADTWRQTHS